MRARIGAASIAAVMVAIGSASAQPSSAALSPRNANYTIRATLEPSTRCISGQETIVWRNISTTTATELQFHLYWNAWKDAHTTWMRERALAGGAAGVTPIAQNDWARITVTSIKLTAPVAVDLTSAQHFITPDEPVSSTGASRAEAGDGADDETAMAVPLPQPVPPGGSVTIELAWSAHVPRTFSRTGAIGNFFFVAQWFPKLGVLEAGGWNCHQFHLSTEFFSDFGVYDVALTVPRHWVVGATGVQRERRDNADGTTMHRYYQEDVHDFVWTTSPDYVERTARFDHPTLPSVDMRLLLQPEHAGQAERHFDATRTTLKYYGEWFGAYPYGHITIVDPAWQSGAGGMEYPTLFTAGTRWLAPAGVITPEGVTIHEAGHQFWYGIVATNEFEHAWMDEGFNTFSTGRAIAEAYNPNFLSVRYFGGFVPWVFRDVRLKRETDDNRLAGYRRDARSDVPATPSFRYFPATGGSITYNKTALWLNTLERWLGWTTLRRGLSVYFDRWKFRHPAPADFFATLNETTGRDLGPFFDQVYRSANVFDYGVQQLQSAKDGAQFRSTIIVRRYGEAIFPVDVLMMFENGEQVREQWDGKDRWKLYEYERPAAIASAAVDPDRVLLLDVNYTNNSRTRTPQGARAATKWSLRWMVWLQDHLLSWVALV